MNDITKARYFLQTKGSKLKELQSFRLMLLTAEAKYRDIRRRFRSGMAGDDINLDAREIDALVDYALLKYLERNNKLPSNAPEVLKASTSLKAKKEIALGWVTRN